MAILGFPFITQARSHHYKEIEIRAGAVDHAVVGKASLEATLHDIDLTHTSWLIRPDAPMRRQAREPHHHRLHACRPVHAHRRPAGRGAVAGDQRLDRGTTESGISGSQGLVFTGTPKASGLDKRVSVSVDLSLTGPDQTTLVLTATGILTGPNTADQPVPDDKLAAVLKEFSTTITGQKLPFGIAPTSQGARGSDIIIEGIAQE